MKKLLLAVFPSGALLLVGLWAYNSLNSAMGSLFADRAGLLLAFGRLAGIAGGLGVMAQLLLVSRAKWVEPLFGLDRLTRYHHLCGLVIPLALLAHPPLIVLYHAELTDSAFLSQYLAMLKWDYVPAAAAGGALLLAAVFLSLPFARRRLSYERWHTAHLGAYLGLALTLGHQINLGGDLAASVLFSRAWFALLAFAGLNLAWYRFLKPLWLYKRHAFTVDRTVMETGDVMSVYLTGRDLAAFAVEPGQFALLRFWAPGFKLQAHPFSFSKPADGRELRFSIKKSGDFTAALQAGLKAGTPVLIDGPHGVFTAAKLRADKVLLIAGGIGITPLRALAEKLSAAGTDTVLLFSNRTRKDIAFAAELDELAGNGSFKVVNVLSEDPGWAGEQGLVDAAALKRLVPDLAGRDAFLCGPPPMIEALKTALAGLGVSRDRVHYELFSL